jgi:hypothetical protein
VADPEAVVQLFSDITASSIKTRITEPNPWTTILLMFLLIRTISCFKVSYEIAELQQP